MDVLSIHYHPEFHAANLYNDLAIVKLDGVVDFQKNPHISPICLPDSFQVRNLPNAKLTLFRLGGYQIDTYLPFSLYWR